RGQRLIEQCILQGTEIAAGAEVQILAAGIFLENVGQAVLVGKAQSFNHGIAEDNRAGFRRVEAAFDVARSIAVGGVLHAKAAALVIEMAVGAVPNAEVGIDVCPEIVVIHVIGGLAGVPIR